MYCIQVHSNLNQNSDYYAIIGMDLYRKLRTPCRLTFTLHILFVITDSTLFNILHDHSNSFSNGSVLLNICAVLALHIKSYGITLVLPTMNTDNKIWCLHLVPIYKTKAIVIYMQPSYKLHLAYCIHTQLNHISSKALFQIGLYAIHNRRQYSHKSLNARFKQINFCHLSWISKCYIYHTRKGTVTTNIKPIPTHWMHVPCYQHLAQNPANKLT